MDVNSVCVFLNKEDNTQLAMFVQEKFLFDLKNFDRVLNKWTFILGKQKIKLSNGWLLVHDVRPARSQHKDLTLGAGEPSPGESKTSIATKVINALNAIKAQWVCK
ncbi:hypothetical protein QJS10_CPA10g01574 [Acorus calamus]|uniref:Uncharacterized protein n=1 Tax=Acorus calamus TaxID=4465 RepID=A0AAV9E0P2_ACOCL|nr:hypothetical protein QJS10_CPA10g01574 [Acorus calamus]